jgi:hypothetical protein
MDSIIRKEADREKRENREKNKMARIRQLLANITLFALHVTANAKFAVSRF